MWAERTNKHSVRILFDSLAVLSVHLDAIVRAPESLCNNLTAFACGDPRGKFDSENEITDRGIGKRNPIARLRRGTDQGLRSALRYVEIHNFEFPPGTEQLTEITRSRRDLELIVSSFYASVVSLISCGEEHIVEERNDVAQQPNQLWAPIPGTEYRPHKDPFEGNSKKEQDRMLKSMSRLLRDPELERYCAYEEVDEEYGNPYDQSDSDPGGVYDFV
ncbi:hypothetical protein BU23DRAFT_598125 [Bimuria novae-zelandiae CBS 107.79]|uniref:Uncharacterized protein n=1 Tax=Bimuria novae-zelandiae CBS 107.79 TaxID=1447943 RepID=A0A6A5VCJ0_9PLEO|nr:hypothetical protein BU23DRAFT_598125 [Bimuria novae-zelandiae CBS 107.79]